MSWNISVSVVNDYGLDNGWMDGWGLIPGGGIFVFSTTSRLALGPTQSPIQWVPGALSLGVKQLGC
jgi:hypothetical protein